jgi:hypothetical protein
MIFMYEVSIVIARFVNPVARRSRALPSGLTMMIVSTKTSGGRRRREGSVEQP